MSDKTKAECRACDYGSCVGSCKDKAAVIERQSAEITKLNQELSASEANIASLEAEDTDAMKARDELWSENHKNERVIKQFMEAALPSREVNTTSPERAVEIVADMRKRLDAKDATS